MLGLLDPHFFAGGSLKLEPERAYRVIEAKVAKPMGLSIEEAQKVVLNAIGGENVTTTIQGRERYPVNVRYKPDFRSDFGALGRLLVPALGGKRQIALKIASWLRRSHKFELPSWVLYWSVRSASLCL